MELATFGAVLSYAVELEKALGALYRQAQAIAPTDLADTFDQNAQACQKREQLMERTRREQVTEMILEPIRGFQSEDYVLSDAPAGGAQSKDLVAALRQAEETAVRYYTDGASHLSIPEVKRIFQRLAKEHAKACA